MHTNIHIQLFANEVREDLDEYRKRVGALEAHTEAALQRNLSDVLAAQSQVQQMHMCMCVCVCVFGVTCLLPNCRFVNKYMCVFVCRTDVLAAKSRYAQCTCVYECELGRCPSH
jgi:hypothetical protein